jgi:hypothetical protein
MKYSKRQEELISFFKSNTAVRWGILVVVTALFTLMLYPNLVVTRRSYAVGDVAQGDVKASKDFFIEDKVATDVKRRQAADSILTVYDFDTELVERLKNRVDQAFGLVQAVYRVPAAETPAARAASDPPAPEDPTAAPEPNPAPTSSEEADLGRRERVWQLKGEFQSILGFPVSDGPTPFLKNTPLAGPSPT